MTRWTAVDVFGNANAHLGSCCSCCAGYCPQLDVPPQPAPPALARVGDYVTDRYVAIKADLVDTDGAHFFPEEPIALPDGWTAPEDEPAESLGRFVASRANRLLDLGIDIRQGEGIQKRQHIFFRGEHIGWIMPALDGLTLDEVRAYARAAKVILRHKYEGGMEAISEALVTDLAFEPIDALGPILRAAEEIRAEIEAATS